MGIFDRFSFKTKTAPPQGVAKVDTEAKAPAKPAADRAYEQGTQHQIENPDTSVISIERAAMGVLGTAMARINLDDLAAKKGLGIYHKMRLDEQVKAVVNFKRDAILSRGWTFEFDTESKLSDDEQKHRIRVFEKIIQLMPGSFIDALNNISIGREYGYSLTEKVYTVVEIDGKSQVGLASLRGRDPASFDFYVDPYGDLIRCEQVAAGQRIQIDLDKFIHYVHNPEFDVYLGRSDLREAYRSWYFKEQMIKFWGFYMEKLGGGFVIAKLTSESQITFGSPQYNALVAVLSSMKASGSILMPKGVEAEAVFPTNSDAFDKAVSWHDLAIAKALLVPNLLGVSNNGGVGSYAQSQTQLDAFAWTVKADTDRLESCVNEQLFKDLGDQNWGDGDYPCFKFKPPTTDYSKWVLETWMKLITGKAVLPTVDDEKRLRELLEMPPRNEDTELVVDPMEEKKLDAEIEQGTMQKEHDLGEKAKDGDVKRGIDEDVQRATHPVLAAEKEKENKAKAEALAKGAKEKKEFAYNPDQERANDGKWTANGASERMQDHIEREINAENPIPALDILKEVYDVIGREKLPSKGVSKEAQNALRSVLTRLSKEHPGSKQIGISKKDHGEATRLLRWLDSLSTKMKQKPSSPARDARISIASARERVDFAVIDRKQRSLGDQLAADMSITVARGVAQLLGSDEELAKLIDKDTSDIGMIEFSGITKGRLKTTATKSLQQAYAMGRQMASDELHGMKVKRKMTNAAYFADLRKNAMEYFENQAFRMSGNIADGARSLIQQELQNSVKYGKSPKQTRETIWDRLTRKGFASREDVRGVETDQDVQKALDILWVDDEEQAAHYLDTLARTSLFESMNEARYGEFKDPALDGFVVALRYSAILDERTTEICTALHDHVYETDSEVWNQYRPPNHFNCRSILVPITQVDVENGEWDGEESESPEDLDVQPQEGFK